MVCLALELVGPWVMLGFSVGMEAFDELLLITVPWSQEFSAVLRFGLKPPASGFQSYSYSSLKISPSVTSKAVPSVCFSFFCLLVSSVSTLF